MEYISSLCWRWRGPVLILIGTSSAWFYSAVRVSVYIMEAALGVWLHYIIFQVRLILSSYIMFYRSWKRQWQGPRAKLSYLLMEVGLLEQPTETYLLLYHRDDRERET